MRIALLGAESTGKTALSQALADRLRSDGRAAALVPEWLREWCVIEGRTPRAEEQMEIARSQAAFVERAEYELRAKGGGASVSAGTLVTDTTPLMIAVYSDLLFGDRSLYDFAIAHQRSYAVTLLMGLDLPWIADGLQRDGPHVRAPVDTLVRAALDGAGIPYAVVYGSGRARLDNALRALGVAADAAPVNPARWICEHCGDSACEHKLFSALRATAPKG